MKKYFAQNFKNLLLISGTVILLSCGGGNGDDSGTIADPNSETASEDARLGTIETDLLALINEERQEIGKPVLVRDPGLDTIMLWKVAEMTTTHELVHGDDNGRGGEERVRYYGAHSSVRCSEIIQWWGGSPSGQVHYDGYFNSPDHHSAYLEEGIYNLGGATDVGIAALSGTGPAGSQFDGRSGSYTGLVFCDTGVTIAINPFSE